MAIEHVPLIARTHLFVQRGGFFYLRFYLILNAQHDELND